jgi:(3S)-malyl-CoA thioesterase
MGHSTHPYRSVLYMPGSRPRALEKARSLPADALILDLEDAVLPAEKPRARDLVAEALRTGGYGGRKLIVRINAFDTEWGRDDLAAVAAAAPDAILLPKVETPEHIREAAALLDGAPAHVRLWAMIETPRSILNAPAIAASHPRLQGFVMGTNDLAKDLGAAQGADRFALVPSLALCLLAARAEGLIAVDGVHNTFRDLDGLRAACVQGRDLGFDGKTLIHPDQIAVANDVFAPTPEEIAHAKAQVAAFEDAAARGEGVAVLDGRIVENLHVAVAQWLLARAAAIAALEAGIAPEHGSGPESGPETVTGAGPVRLHGGVR